MEEHIELKKTGLKATLPRLKVLNIFENNREGHLSAEDIYKIIKKGKKKLLKVKILYEGPVEAPIRKDQVLAKLKIIYDDELIDEYDLLAKEQVNKVNIFSRLMKSLNYLIWGDV